MVEESPELTSLRLDLHNFNETQRQTDLELERFIKERGYAEMIKIQARRINNFMI